MRQVKTAPQGPFVEVRIHEVSTPLEYAKIVGGRPCIDFSWREDGGGKRRLIGNPNKATRRLHALLEAEIKTFVKRMGDDENYPLRRLPSSTAFVRGSNHLKNALKHIEGKFFYITDIQNAYPSVDLKRLAAILVYLRGYREYKFTISLRRLGQSGDAFEHLRSDPLFNDYHTFLQLYCAGLHGEGLAVGGPLSPLLFNLYCEVYVDSALRKICENYDITMTRYADDLVFSREKPIIGDIRRELREIIARAGFTVNHRKSRVLSREMGTTFVTKVGLHDSRSVGTPMKEGVLVFPQKKRRRLHGMIGSYLSEQTDWPEKVSGFVAEFIYYHKNVKVPTATDRKTFRLCREFEREWSKYHRPR